MDVCNLLIIRVESYKELLKAANISIPERMFISDKSSTIFFTIFGYEDEDYILNKNYYSADEDYSLDETEVTYYSSSNMMDVN